MNRTKLKNYAPQARRDFIQAATDRAAYFGLKTIDGKVVVEPVTEKGDSVLIGGKAFPRKVGEQRKRLEERVRQHGFKQTMEALAYTWFNRLVAIRFMELHDYLENGEGGASYRVLSNPDKDKPTPEILEKAEHVTLEMLDKQEVINLKLDGTKEVELYRLLLIAECNALNSAMPFLFEKIDDETELVLPDNLLHSDSLIRKLVNEIDEEDWQEVEIIGWMYQFYISEKKDEVIGKVVASEDIPAATQLFTPNWIVKYLVQNTLGRQWLTTYPQSVLRQQMAYYIEPSEQTPEVQEQLKAITPTSLNPEEITLLDPACGSGHILVEAYDLFKAIYQERGYRAKDIPRLILQKNLFGLEIDDRAAQLAAFALMMKARADDRRIFTSEAKPNVLALQESKGMNARDITAALNAPILKEKLPPSQYLLVEIEDEENPLFGRKAMSERGHISQADVSTFVELFEDAKTFGSLIQIPPTLAAKLPEIDHRLRDVLRHGDLTHATAGVMAPLIQQARMLTEQYDAVVANPPYMGWKYFVGRLKEFVLEKYKEAKADLYACFIQRNATFAKANGFFGLITIPNWMFLSSFEDTRTTLLAKQTFDTFVHNGRGVFGSDFGSCSFVVRKFHLPEYRAIFRKLFDKQGSVSSNEELEQRFFSTLCYTANSHDLSSIPGSPVAYWVSEPLRAAFRLNPSLGLLAVSVQGIITGDNDKYLRLWHEPPYHRLAFGKEDMSHVDLRTQYWIPYNKGGEARKWYGNNRWIINWKDQGRHLHRARTQNTHLYLKPGMTWTRVSMSFFNVRYVPSGFLSDVNGSSVFAKTPDHLYSLLGLLCSNTAPHILEIMNPSVVYQVEDLLAIPVPHRMCESTSETDERINTIIGISKTEWDSFETSWDFQTLPILRERTTTVQRSQESANEECLGLFRQMKRLEEQNNLFFIDAYGLRAELSPEVPEDQITLYRPDRLENIKRLLSYAIGCMMGRYSLDKSGLIYAQSGNVGFDPSQYNTFAADDDGILPVLEADWGIRDDAANRILDFIGMAWPKEHLEENLKFIAESLGPTKNEHSRDTIRRYLATGFYKDHLRWYKRRPIYWLFSSGKQRAFQCLVYLHRYHEGTLARMRTEYVIPLQGKIAARIEQLEGDKNKATSTSHGRKLQKEQDDLKKQQTELFAFDEKLKHAADQKIALDLDDGVKVNYAKFGDLLAEVKAVTGGKDEE